MSNALLKLLSYEKIKRDSITNIWIVAPFRFSQICIVGYIICWNLLYKHGYQKVAEGDVVTTAQLEGVIETNFSHNGIEADKEMYSRVWDSAEYASIPSDTGFFVATNVIITPNQTLGKCDEDPYVTDANCTDERDCIEWLDSNLGNGHRTGRCIPSTIIDNQNVCEVNAWCPIEHEKFPLQNSSLLNEAADFTVFLRSEVYFHQFGEQYRRNNILKTQDENFLKTCRYDKIKSPYCPIFSIKTLVREAKQDFRSMSILGGVIFINIKWDCNLDFSFEDDCKPVYKFRRVDNDGFNPVKGYSFRISYHHDLKRRSLVRYNGIRFFFKNHATGRKFSMIHTVGNIAVALSLLKLIGVPTGNCKVTLPMGNSLSTCLSGSPVYHLFTNAEYLANSIICLKSINCDCCLKNDAGNAVNGETLEMVEHHNP